MSVVISIEFVVVAVGVVIVGEFAVVGVWGSLLECRGDFGWDVGAAGVVGSGGGGGVVVGFVGAVKAIELIMVIVGLVFVDEVVVVFVKVGESLSAVAHRLGQGTIFRPPYLW